MFENDAIKDKKLAFKTWIYRSPAQRFFVLFLTSKLAIPQSKKRKQSLCCNAVHIVFEVGQIDAMPYKSSNVSKNKIVNQPGLIFKPNKIRWQITNVYRIACCKARCKLPTKLASGKFTFWKWVFYLWEHRSRTCGNEITWNLFQNDRQEHLKLPSEGFLQRLRELGARSKNLLKFIFPFHGSV